jgi:hypothetical protein
MKTKISGDRRNEMWRRMEKEIYSGARRKDKLFILSGKWKKFVRKQSGYKIYRVDGSWVRHNLLFYFGHGGHGFVHEFIPTGEIWVSSHHPYEGKGSMANCVCKLHKKGQKMSDNYFNSTTLHELTECNQMKNGKTYWAAHNIALKVEHKAGLVKDPYSDL